jgi:hypothetical protein
VSNFEEACSKLPFGIADFDFKLVPTPNRDRGIAAHALFDVRDEIGREAAFAGMMAAYEHDHRAVADAFWGDIDFARSLKMVAPEHGPGLVRVWRGIIVEKAAIFLPSKVRPGGSCFSKWRASLSWKLA